jgi:hypothetical protein
VIERRYISFEGLSSNELSVLIIRHPLILKSLLILTGVRGNRAIARDLKIKNLDTYNPRLTDENAKRIAEYLLPLLPDSVGLDTIAEIDRIEFIDKEIRARKGRWEKQIIEGLPKAYGVKFKKRRISHRDMSYEIDAAYPEKGTIQIGIDVKRIEAVRDLHKRCDEISNKARSLKGVYPKAKFITMIYYPFDENDIRNRLKGSKVDLVVFGGSDEQSIGAALKEMSRKIPIRQ